MQPFLSCKYLHYGIALHSKGVRVCCKKFFRKDLRYSGNPFICNYSDGEVPFSYFLTRKKSIINQLNNGIENDCTGCSRLKMKNWPELTEVKIKKLLLQHRKICNLRCIYCNLSRDKNAINTGIDALPIVHNMISEGMLDKDLVVHWGSGEPTIFPDFDDTFNLLCKYGAKHTLSSNSTIFKQSLYDNIDKIHNITTSIDAGFPKTYKSIRGRDMLNKVLKNLSTYAKRKPDVITIQYVICDPGDKKDEIDQFIENISNYGLNKCNFSITTDVEQPLTNRYLRKCKYLTSKLSEIVDHDKIRLSKQIIQRIGSFRGHYHIIAQSKFFASLITCHTLRKKVSTSIESAIRHLKQKKRKKQFKKFSKKLKKPFET
jgi:wyosine [tRNA(Phe)-imidazoG37] synthetase (radical SAM superfamily)